MRGAEHAPHHLTGQGVRDRGRVVADFLGERAGNGHQLRLRNNAGNETAGKRFRGREDAARIAPFQRLLDADEARQEPAGSRFRVDAALVEHEAEARVVGRDADIHRQLHRHADADRRAVDGADHGLQAFEDAQGQAAAAIALDVDVLRAALFAVSGAGVIVERLGAGREVCAGAEGFLAVPGDDHGLHAVILVGDVEGLDHLVHHHAGEGVHVVRAVDGQRGDAVLDVENDFLELFRASHLYSSGLFRWVRQGGLSPTSVKRCPEGSERG